MAKVFLDANIFIDLLEGRGKILEKKLDKSILFVSTLSIEIWSYVYKHSIPDEKCLEFFNTFNFVDYTSSIAKKSFSGPTADFEDNIQLHSASESGCDVFITNDKKLLQIGYFGKVRICNFLDR